ncbi:unnamed protein product [Prunus armeniaca]|nr:unnamed protein product [Prunus armeniaca]
MDGSSEKKEKPKLLALEDRNVARKDRVDGWKKMKHEKIVIRMSTGQATSDPMCDDSSSWL